MSHIFVITKTVYLSLIFFVVGEQWRLRCLMVSLTCLVLLLCHFMTQSLFILSQCVAITLNGFRKHAKCMAPNQRWYVTLTFCVWMWMTCKKNMNSVDLSDQLWNVYQVDQCMLKYKWWWYIFFCFHGLILLTLYIIYKPLYQERKVKSMRHYEFQRVVFLENNIPNNFGGRDHLVLAVQRWGIMKKYGYMLTTHVSEWLAKKRN